jgi:HEAT repeat protein
MSLRAIRAASFLALGFGLYALTAGGDLFAASKEAEAKKYHELLKSATDAKGKVLALDELGKLGLVSRDLTEKALPDMMKALKDKDATVRAAAAEAVGKCDPDPADAVPALVDLLKNDKSEAVKLAAAKGLGLMGEKAKDATDTLKDVQKANDKKSKLAKAAQDALRSIGGQRKK